MLFTFITLVQLKRIQACCLIGVVCTNYFLDHTATRRWSVFKSPGRLCFDNEVLGGHSRTTNWRIHFRQLTGNTFHSRNLSTNIDLRWRHGEHSKTKGHKHIKSVSNTEISLQVIKQKGKKCLWWNMPTTMLCPHSSQWWEMPAWWRFSPYVAKKSLSTCLA